MNPRISHSSSPAYGNVFREVATFRGLAIAFAGSLFLAVSSWISVPMVPVPMTMQSFAVLFLGALLGWRLAGLSILLYLGEAAVGFPVLANGASGLVRFVGPTGGYLLAFPVAAMAVGWVMRRSWSGGYLASFCVMLCGHALILVAGTTWLATFLGSEKAIAAGLTPFLLGSVVKSALVVASLDAVRPARLRLGL